jgi:hypothetical protein
MVPGSIQRFVPGRAPIGLGGRRLSPKKRPKPLAKIKFQGHRQEQTAIDFGEVLFRSACMSYYCLSVQVTNKTD